MLKGQVTKIVPINFVLLLSNFLMILTFDFTFDPNYVNSIILVKNLDEMRGEKK